MPVNDLPVIADIPDQSIEEGASFSTINLDGYIEDIEDSDTVISWEVSGYSELSIDGIPRNSADTLRNFFLWTWLLWFKSILQF
jgi:hypothetical protein